MSVDEDAARLDVEQPEQQVDHRRLAGPRRTDQRHPLARPDMQVEVLDDAAALAIMERHILEDDVAFRWRQYLRICGVANCRTHRYRARCVLHGCVVAHQAVDVEHHPARHLVEAENQPQRCRDRAGRNPAAGPFDDADRSDRAHHDAVDDGNCRAHRGHCARQPHHRRIVAFQPVAHIGMLAPSAVEQLDRHDVGEGVDQPAVEHRAFVGRCPPGPAHLGQQVPDDAAIARNPERHHQSKPRVHRAQDGDRQHHEGHEGPHGLQHVDDEIADGLAALHDLGGDTAGEIVLVEVVGLFDDAPERLPAHHRIEARHDNLLLDQRRADHHHRPDHQEQRQKPGEFRPVLCKQRLRRGRIQHVDQPADRPVERGVNRAGQSAHDEQQRERPLGLPGKIEDEAPGRRRQHLAVGVVKGIDGALEAPPQILAKAWLVERHSAACPSGMSAAGSSNSRNPPDWRAHKLRVEAALCDQRVVRAFLDDFALVHHHQPVHGGDRRQPVRNGDHGLALHQSVEVLLDRRLDLRIERRRGLVQNENRRILQHNAGNGDALPLASRQLHAAFADMRVEPFRPFASASPR